MNKACLAIGIITLIAGLSILANETYVQQTNMKNRKAFGWKRAVRPYSTDKGMYNTTWAKDGNLLYYPAVDANLMQIAGSGKMY